MYVPKTLMSFSLLIALFFTLVSSPAYSNTCIGYYKTLDAKIEARKILDQQKQKFFQPGYTVDAQGALRLHVTRGRNIFEKSLNKISDIIFQFILRRLGAHVVFPKIKNFLNDTSEDLYFTKIAKHFGIEVQYDEAQLAAIPKTGPLVIVANHPLSGIDGIVLGAMIERVRPDARVVLTSLLKDFNGMIDHSILINPFGGRVGRAFNLFQRDLMREHLEQGKSLVIFPSGEVSKKNDLSEPFAIDPQWKRGVATLIESVPETQIVPVFVEGQPSEQLLRYKIERPSMTTVMIVKDLTTRLGEPVNLIIGSPISAEDLQKIPNRSSSSTSTYEIEQQRTSSRQLERMAYLKARTYVLKDMSGKKTSETRRMDLVPEEMSKAIVMAELEKLPTLYDQAPGKPKGFKVVIAEPHQIPQTLLEIGRLREITFREVGEGSGKSRDIDQYDSYYTHIIVYRKESEQIAGSYRIARIGEVLDTKGYEALYTSNFFNYKSLAPQLRNGIELGRSFVLPEFQRSLALFALFNGIAQYLVQNPQYRHLIGSVSIPNDLPENVKYLLVEYLRINHGVEISSQVKNTTRVNHKSLLTPEEIRLLLNGVETYKQFEKLIKDLFGPKMKLPPLIQIYLDLGVRFLSFDFDKDFNTIDGFIWTDLPKQSHETLKKFMGDDGATSYLNHNNNENPQ